MVCTQDAAGALTLVSVWQRLYSGSPVYVRQEEGWWQVSTSSLSDTMLALWFLLGSPSVDPGRVTSDDVDEELCHLRAAELAVELAAEAAGLAA